MSLPHASPESIRDILRGEDVLLPSDGCKIGRDGKVIASPEVKERIAAWLKKDDNERWGGREIEAREYGLHAYKVLPSEKEMRDAVNPKYSSGDPKYTNNCQRCVVAYELQRRGIMATADEFMGNGGYTMRHWIEAFGKGKAL